jgi:RNA polymerase sigma-70 factor (ECF subfamily)
MGKPDTTGEYAIPNVETRGASRTDDLPLDSDAFASFYQRSAPALRAYLERVSGNSALAEDLMQESYLRFLCASHPEGGEVNYRRYLFRIATNLLRDRWRRHKEDSLPDPVPEVASSTPHPDLRIEVRQAFRRLKHRERQLLWLAYVEGSSHKEIADSTGLKASSVRLLLLRARRKLAGFIGRGPRDSGSEVDV